MLTIPRLDFGGKEKSECGKENYSKVRRQHFGDRRRAGEIKYVPCEQPILQNRKRAKTDSNIKIAKSPEDGWTPCRFLKLDIGNRSKRQSEIFPDLKLCPNFYNRNPPKFSSLFSQSPPWWLSMPLSSSSPPSSTSSSSSTSTSMSLSTLFEFDFVPTWIPTRFQLTFETTVRTSDNVNPIFWSYYIILQSSPQPKQWIKSLYLDGYGCWWKWWKGMKGIKAQGRRGFRAVHIMQLLLDQALATITMTVLMIMMIIIVASLATLSWSWRSWWS